MADVRAALVRMLILSAMFAAGMQAASAQPAVRSADPHSFDGEFEPRIAAQGCILFPVAPIPVGAEPTCSAAADFDDDGDQDLVVSNAGDRTLSVLLNRGDGRYDVSQTLPGGLLPRKVAVGDLDGKDGVDIVVADSLGDAVLVYFNTGPGVFPLAPDQTISTGDGLTIDGPIDLLVNEMNGTLGLDIVVAAEGSRRVFTLLNDGNGAFPNSTSIDPGATPSSVAVADLDSDAEHDLDLAVSLAATNRVAILRNVGGGSFSQDVLLGNLRGPIDIVLEDLNNDGRPDLVVAASTSDSIIIRRNNGGLSFGSPTIIPVNGSVKSLESDFINTDAARDIVVVSSKTASDEGVVTVLTNSGNGSSFSAAQYAVQRGASHVTITDVDIPVENDVDLVVTNTEHNSVSVLWNRSPIYPTLAGHAVYSAGIEPRQVIFADTDQQAGPELIIADSAADEITVLFNRGLGRYASPMSFPVGTDPADVQAGDLNGDARNDLVVSNRGSNDLSILINDGGGVFAPPVNIPIGEGPAGLDLGLIDEDGFLDVVVARGDGNTVAVLFGNGGGGFDPPVLRPVDGQPTDLILADLDGDGDQDIAVTNRSLARGNDTVTIIANNGARDFSNVASIPVGNNPVALAAGRLNEDSIEDLVVANFDDDTISVIYSSAFPGDFLQNVGVFTYPAAGGPTSVAFGRLEASDKLDVFVTSTLEGRVRVFINLMGAGELQETTPLDTGVGVLAIDTADLNDDLLVDLGFINPLDGTASVAINLGALPTEPPVIDSGPTISPNSQVPSGTNVTISAAGLGLGPLLYQWLHNGNILSDSDRISGTKLPVLSISSAITADSGKYTVIVTDSCGRIARSTDAILEVIGETDTDGDGIPDDDDNCPTVFNPGQLDTFDNDGVGNDCDNCLRLANPDQADTRPAGAPDGIGDGCDCLGDANRDGRVDFNDTTTLLQNFGATYTYPNPANSAQGDTDLSGRVDFDDIATLLRNFGNLCR